MSPRAALVAIAVLSASPSPGQSYAPGAFGAAIPLPGAATALVAADLDADGDLDLVAAVGAPPSLTPLFRAPNGTFSAGTGTALAAGTVTGLVAGLIDADVYPDLIVASATPPYLRTALSTGPGTWSVVATNVQPPAPPVAQAAGDSNFDGWFDVAVAYAGVGGVGVDLLAGVPGQSTFSATPLPAAVVGGATLRLFLTDVDGDFDPDLVEGVSGAGLFVRANLGGAGFAAPVVGAAITGPITDLAVDDFDRDGTLDVATFAAPGTFGLSGVSILRATSPGVYAPTGSALYGTSSSATVGRALDFDRDGFPDLLAVHGGTGVVELFPGDGAGGFAAYPTPLPQPTSFATVSATLAGPAAAVALDADLDSDLLLATTAAALVPLRATHALAVGAPATIGASFPLTFDAPSEAGLAYLMAAAGAPIPGYGLPDGRIIPLAIYDGTGLLDPLFVLTTTPGCGGFCSGFYGVLDAAGRAVGTVNVPNQPALVGFPIFFAAASLSLAAPSNVSLVPNGHFVQLR